MIPRHHSSLQTSPNLAYSNLAIHETFIITFKFIFTGKTMQAVGLIETLRVLCRRPGPYIVVVPLSTIRHWQKEFDERSQANTVVLHGTNEDRDVFVGSEFTSVGARTWIAHFDVIITTYETVQQELSFLKQLKFTAMVIDEAHRLKNSATQVRGSLKDLDVDFTVLLTGIL